MNSNDRNIIDKSKLQALVDQIDPRYSLDPEVEQILLAVADEFIESVTGFGCALAKHRGSETLDVKDLQLPLERDWDVRVPGFGTEDRLSKPYKKTPMTDVHKQRLGLVKRSMYQLQKQAEKQQKKRRQLERGQQQQQQQQETGHQRMEDKNENENEEEEE